jgi:hypothetical protein
MSWPNEQCEIGDGLQSYAYSHDSRSPKNWGAITSVVLKMRELTEGWDGEFAEPPPQQTIDRTLEVLRQCRAQGIDIPDSVECAPDGDVHIIWYCVDGNKEIQVYSDLNMCFVDHENGTTVEIISE